MPARTPVAFVQVHCGHNPDIRPLPLTRPFGPAVRVKLSELHISTSGNLRVCPRIRSCSPVAGLANNYILSDCWTEKHMLASLVVFSTSIESAQRRLPNQSLG